MLLTVGYVVALALWTAGGRRPQAWGLAIGALCLALVGSRRTGVVGASYWGFAVGLASLAASPQSTALDAAGAIGFLACAASACVAMASMPADGGVVRTRPISAVVPLAVLAVASCAAAGPLLYPLYASPPAAIWSAKHAGARDAAILLASACALLGLTERTLRARRLELGVVERALAARSFQALSFSFTLLFAILAPAQARAIGRLGLGLASACVVATCVAPDAVRVVRVARRGIALAVSGGGIALLAAFAAHGSSAGWVAGLSAAVALAIGSGSWFVEKPLRPAGGAWLDAFARAREDAVRADPDAAIGAVLLALRGPGGPGQPSPELWTFAPPTQTTVDAAGYVREQAAELPPDLLGVVTAEPEGALRADVLDALEVRRPDLRPLCAWMAARGALLASLIAWEGEPEGILILPRGLRTERVTLEELRAMRSMGDCLAGACRARAASARMRASVREATALVEAAEARAQRGAGHEGLVLARATLAEQRLARPAELGIYSAVARMAVAALERGLAAGAPVLVIGPSGLDPVPFVVRAHLRGAKTGAPLVLVEGTDPQQQQLARWCDAEISPLALADGGVLVVADISTLPADVQATLGRACLERRAPWDAERPLSVQVVATTVRSADGRIALALDPHLESALGHALTMPVILPRLGERADDFRALLLEGLAREGMRVIGKPVGIEPSAYAQLTNYEFPGDVAELSVVVQRLVAACRGDTVRVGDVEALGIRAIEARSSAPRGRIRKDPISA